MATKRENTAREDISLADRVFAVSEMKKHLAAAKQPCDGFTIATQFGTSETTVSRYLRVAKRLDADVFRAWRNLGEIGITLNEISNIAKLDKDLQGPAFLSLCADKADKDAAHRVQTVQLSDNDVVEVLESGTNMTTGERVSLLKDGDSYSVGVINVGSERRARLLLSALEPLIMNPLYACPSCDDKGCGFCVPNEPHGQPTE